MSEQASSIEIPDVDITSFVLEHAAERGERPALIDGPSGRTITYGELGEQVAALARRRSPSAASARATSSAIYLPNVPEYAVAFHGAASAGGRDTTANPLYTPSELGHQLDGLRREAARSRSPTSSRPRARPPSEAGIEEIVVARRGRRRRPRSPTCSRARAAIARQDRHRPPNDLAVAAVLERHHRPAQGRDADPPQPGRQRAPDRSRPHPGRATDDTMIGCLPFFHIYGMTVIMNHGPAQRGDDRDDAALRPRAVPRADRASTRSPSPSSSRRSRSALAKHPAVDDADLSLAADDDVGRRAARRRAGRARSPSGSAAPSIQGYGMTETQPRHPHDRPVDAATRPGSIGPPLRRRPSAASSTPRAARTSPRASAASSGSAGRR